MKKFRNGVVWVTMSALVCMAVDAQLGKLPADVGATLFIVAGLGAWVAAAAQAWIWGVQIIGAFSKARAVDQIVSHRLSDYCGLVERERRYFR
jgi:hypothetical protein